jgi:anti-sigma regulatory factor (Ser/Thr protein kinase)
VAREFLRICFTDWDLTELYDDAALALTELVANAVMHAATPLVVAVSCEGGMVEIAVHDGNPSMPAIPPPRADDEGDIRQAGRGLLLVDALSAQWGVSPLSDGKAVWVRTPVPRGWPHGADCPCAEHEEPNVLGSGRHVVHRG